MKGNDEIVRGKEKPIDKYILIYTHICMKQFKYMDRQIDKYRDT